MPPSSKHGANRVVRALRGQEPPDAIVIVGLGKGKEVHVFRNAWPDAKLMAFEPHPDFYESWRERFPGKIFPLAVSVHEGWDRLYLKPRHMQASSLFRRSDVDDSSVIVRRTTLNMAWQLHGPLGGRVLLWLDCEGSELKALAGADEMLPHVQWINCEVTPYPERPGWPAMDEVDARIRSLGFSLIREHSKFGDGTGRDRLYGRI